MEKKCRYCAMMIPGKAKICPYCRKTQGWTIGAIIGSILVFLFLMIMLGTMASKDQTSSSPSEDDLPKLAFYKAQEYVRANLKAPASATFPYYDSGSVTRVAGDQKGAMFDVISYVDSQNSFGAKIRTSFKCSIVRVYANSSWVLAELKTW
jgi:hypothetical protein